MRFFIYIFIFCSLRISAQSWYPMGNGFTNGSPCVTQSISSYQGTIVANGYFKQTGTTSVNAIAQWTGNQWQPLGLGLWRADTTIITSGSKLVEYHNKLYATGGFDGAGGITIGDSQHLANGIAMWDASDWYPLTPPPLPSGLNSACYAMCEYRDNLYVGGYFGNTFDSSGFHTTRGIARWNDTVFSSVGQLDGNFPPWGYYAAISFCVFNDQLIVSGFFTTIDGMPYGTYNFVAAWNDTSWSALGTGLNAPVYSLSVYNGELYAGGEFTATGDGLIANHIAKWNGLQWLPVGVGVNDTILTLCTDTLQNKLYAGGKFTLAGSLPANYIASWDGLSWSGVGGGANDFVYSLYSADSNLYVGGAFTQVGAITANRIAVWGSNPVGINELNKENRNINLYPNPNNGIMQLEYRLSEAEVCELKIFDVTGRLVAQYDLNPSETILQINQTILKHGLYLYQVLTNGQVVVSDKLIIIK